MLVYTFVYCNEYYDTMTALVWVAVVFGIFPICMLKRTQSAVHWVFSLQVNQSQSVKLIASTLAPSSDMELCGVLPFTPTWFLSHMKCRLLFKCIFKIIGSKKGCKCLKVLIFFKELWSNLNAQMMKYDHKDFVWVGSWCCDVILTYLEAQDICLLEWVLKLV